MTFQLPSPLGARASTVANDSALQMCYIPNFLAQSMADALFERLRKDISWGDERMKLFGIWHAVPRLVAWCGEPHIDYPYAGRTHACEGWFASLVPLRARLLDALQATFNFVLLNRYRDGADAMGWHADDEACLGGEPLIASISLGATRRLRIRARHREREPSTAIDLQHGSLLLAWGNSQRDYQHCLTRTRKAVGERINLTFRNVVNVD